MSCIEATTDRNAVRKWSDDCASRPSKVDTQSEGGMLCLDSSDKDDALEEIGWEEFFEFFEDSKLALVHQHKTADGKTSRFAKFVARR